MKFSSSLISVSSLFLAGAVYAQGAATTAPTATGATSAGTDKHPCKAIEAACEAAGYVKGGAKKGGTKGLFKDCMRPIMSGQTPAGVNVNAADVAACKAHHAKKQ